MTDTERDDLRKILTSQLRMEMSLKALKDKHDEHCAWTERVLSGDESDTTPGLIKRVDRLDQQQQSAARWIGGVWALVVAGAGSFVAWLLNQGSK